MTEAARIETLREAMRDASNALGPVTLTPQATMVYKRMIKAGLIASPLEWQRVGSQMHFLEEGHYWYWPGFAPPSEGPQAEIVKLFYRPFSRGNPYLLGCGGEAEMDLEPGTYIKGPIKEPGPPANDEEAAITSPEAGEDQAQAPGRRTETAPQEPPADAGPEPQPSQRPG